MYVEDLYHKLTYNKEKINPMLIDTKHVPSMQRRSLFIPMLEEGRIDVYNYTIYSTNSSSLQCIFRRLTSFGYFKYIFETECISSLRKMDL